MKGVTASSYKGMGGYWKRKEYERLNGPGLRRKNRAQTTATMGSNRRRRFWRVKIKPRLRFFNFCSPKNFFKRLRDTYVKLMVGFGNSRVCNGLGGGGSASVAYGFGNASLKEYDPKFIIQIYKSLMEHPELLSYDAPNPTQDLVSLQ